jgi:hypothetical protein
MIQAARAEGEVRPLTTMALVPEGRMQKDVQKAEDGKQSVIASLVMQGGADTCCGQRFGVKQGRPAAPFKYALPASPEECSYFRVYT